VYPNPSQGSATLAFPPATFEQLEVYNVLGKQVATFAIESSQQNLFLPGDLAAGQYWLVLNGAKGRQVVAWMRLP
jgi:hypothetical protein